MADVQKSAFSLSSATIMMAPAFSVPVFDLQPSLHSVGMVSDVSISLDSSIIELPNGVSQVTVDAKRTNIKPSISGNVFEQTAQNYMRAQALNGTPVSVKRGVLSADLAASAVSVSINSDPIPGETTSAITSLTDIPSGSTLLIQGTGATGLADYVFPTKSTAAATGTGPFVIPIASPYAIPAAMSFTAGAHVWIVSPVKVGDINADDLFGVKITGVLTNYERPVTVVFPKVRMVKGFEIAYTETQYKSMPWQMQPLLMSKTESATGRLADIGSTAPGMVYVAA